MVDPPARIFTDPESLATSTDLIVWSIFVSSANCLETIPQAPNHSTAPATPTADTPSTHVRRAIPHPSPWNLD
ncbi:hypothetical protein [Alloactinosynnema sp. L-07]|nr:hypothetical protein [Alloactinosynnema sp. L-07]